MHWGSSVAESCGRGRRRGLHLVWLWLWYRLAATDLIRPLAWEPPYAAGVALKKRPKKKKKKKKKKGIVSSWLELKGPSSQLIPLALLPKVQYVVLREFLPWKPKATQLGGRQNKV